MAKQEPKSLAEHLKLNPKIKLADRKPGKFGTIGRPPQKAARQAAKERA